MVCNSCGGEYDDKAFLCPYCNTENTKVAAKIKKDILHKYDKEANRIKKELPGHVVKKGTSIYIKLLLGIFALMVIASIVVLIFSQLSVDQNYKKQKKAVAVLEQYFQAGEYIKIRDYLRKNNVKINTQKYSEIGKLANREESILEYLDWYGEYTDSLGGTNYAQSYRADALREAIKFIEESESYCTDKVITGNEDAVKKYQEKIIAFMLDNGFTKEELIP